jgi:hypothetical protein
LNGRIKRRSSKFAFIGVIVFATSLGCRIDSKIKRRSIDELYGDAIAAAAVRPASVQPAFRSDVPGTILQDAALNAEPIYEAATPTVSVHPFRDASGAERPKELVEAWVRDEGSRGGSTTNGESTADFIPGDSPTPIVGAPVSLTPQRAMNPITGQSEPTVIEAAAFNGDDEASESLKTDELSNPLPSRLATPPDSLQLKSDSQDAPLRMTDIFDQTDIYEVIQILSAHFKVPIIADDSIGGLVTATIEDETLDEVLSKILLPLGLIHALHEGRYIIAPSEPGSPLFTFIAKRSTYSPSNHNVVPLVALLPTRFRPFIQTSPERNIAVIEAPDRLLKEIMTRLAELDTPIGQVELEAIVCVVSPDSGFRFGFDWNHIVGANDTQSLRIGLAGLAMSGSASNNGVQDAFSDFAVTSAFMRLLAQEGYITIRAAPRVTARDGEKASISLNRETFFSLQPDASNVFFRQDVQKVEAGISLEIVPRIHGDMIAVEIAKAEVSEDIRSSSNADVSANPFPIINRRVVSTKVNVRDGNTIVIGGLVQRQTVDKINRIPGLSGLPAIGKLFQTVEKQEQDVEVAVFISPRIVPPDPNHCPP